MFKTFLPVIIAGFLGINTIAHNISFESDKRLHQTFSGSSAAIKCWCNVTFIYKVNIQIRNVHYTSILQRNIQFIMTVPLHAKKILFLENYILTHISITSFLWDIGK